ncbi:MAG: hypothetical protein H0W12_00200 [Chitinophagaceae bacterium]|nr:hypothetical protein [Chitinophagaceae bacterium]
MKKVLLFLLIIITIEGYAQPYNNSWIDYSKTYYKFKVGSTGLYRISQASLSTITLGNTPAEQFQLWRNGVQVTMYTTSPSGPLGGSGYIEFWGLMNDGKKDTKLYRDPDYQLSDHWSLETDTSSYFLTVNPAGGNSRYTNNANNVAGNVLPVEPYFMNTRGVYYKNMINPGFAQPVGLYVYSSSYDIGEGFTSNDISPGDFNPILNNLNVYASGPPATFRIGAAGNAPNTRNLRVKFYNTVIMDEAMPQFTYKKRQIDNIPLADFINPDDLSVVITNTSAVTTDRMVVSFFEVKYPSKFIFNNQANFEFELPATASGNYLVINSFNYGSTAPVLLDLNTSRRYTGDISTPGQVKFVLPPSADPSRKFILISEDAGNINAVNTFTPRNFVNYSTAANQGDYMIISNPLIFNNGSGVNNVDQYRIYRNSTAGGSFNAKIFDINELTDQFAYGIKKHPLAIKDFIQFTKTSFSTVPKYVFLIGKGVTYNEYTINQNNPVADRLNLVQTFGNPASDVLLASNYGSIVPDVPVGRLSVTDGNEVGIYLDKMKQYEAAQASTTQTVADKAWMKNIVHVIGGGDSLESASFESYMNQYKQVIEDTFYGGKVETFIKSTSVPVQNLASQRITELFNEGISLLAYFGHSSANILAFNLDNPDVYQNAGKYPFFNVSGCTAGNNYVYDPLRLQGELSISEKFVLANQRGSIGFLASSHLGIPPYLNNYNNQLYAQIGVVNYGNTIGNQIKNTIRNLGGDIPVLDFFSRANLEEIALHGDPALKINTHAKPDYIIESPMIRINPAIVSVADNSYTLNIKILNIGKAINDSIRVLVTRKLPNDSINIIFNKKIAAPKYADSLNFTETINPIADKGLNRITVTLDVDNKVPELSEFNNTASADFYIFEDEVRPVFPYNFSIINHQNINFFGSTANPLAGQRQILMEIDTTELFNSAFKKSLSVISTGGVIQFTPSITYADSTVYYWRVGMTPVSGPVVWNNASFVYLPNSSTGFNQSHYYQHLKSTYVDITYNGTFAFAQQPLGVILSTGNYPPNDVANVYLNVGTSRVANFGNNFGTLQFAALDPKTLNGLPNHNPGLYKSNPPGTGSRQNQFEYYFNTLADRNKAITILDSIPDKDYVFLYNLLFNGSTYSYVDAWKTDAAANGNGTSLYNRLIQLGFTKLDSFTSNKPFIFIYKKNDPSFTPIQMIGTLATDLLVKDLTLQEFVTSGTIESPVFGLAKAWKALHWRGKNVEPAFPDSVKIEVYGINNSGTKVKLAVVGPATDTTLAFINAAVYPNLTLKMINSDRINATPNQLIYWRVDADYVPEGAIAPNILFKMKDTVTTGENIDFAVAFKNISETAFDSLKIKFSIIDNNNVQHIISIPKKKALQMGDTLIVSYSIDTRNYTGINTLFVEVNPDNDQPEQYHFNNFIYKNFYVKGDAFNPLLDVTFDGVHILNRDIVSARPHITIKLKDENAFLLLNDTSLIKVQIRYPDGTLRTYHFDNDTLRFTPANASTGDNTATIDLSPVLPGEDDEYELIVSGQDRTGNKAGALDYHIDFRVINKPMISNLLNYPNPFTSSTAFVFTVTGIAPPQNIRIQILTITGKIVREITSQELGPVHVGRNITDFKWDGTDMYGQKLANGVYLYRVLTNLNGKKLDKFKDDGDNTDKYFTKGYGKMYLMH